MTNGGFLYSFQQLIAKFIPLSFVIGFLISGHADVCYGEADKELAAELPPIRREFRAAWVATVANIDWPSKPALSTKEQQEEMLSLLDDAVRLNLNAIILQVRPSCDALYASELEPWSEFLTGKMGQAPEPFYDPLTFAVEEAHKRGLEMHVWFNPYRTRNAGAKTPASDNHITKTHPEICKEYGEYRWMDPGEPASFEHTMAVIRDVVKRYDIDGVHMDDYFYPYPVTNDKGELVPFPDDPSWEKAKQKAKEEDRKITCHDWRRDNINRLVQQIHADIKKIKPWVKFGISPFGIGRPGKPAQIQGLDQYESLYADAEKWFKEGWVDYLTPQLYWKIGPPKQSYPALLEWWHQQNKAKRHLWPGNYTSRMLNNEDGKWTPDELIAQIWVTRAQEGATGNVHFSMKALSRNAGGIADALVEGPYREPALIPESPWLSDETPEAPAITNHEDNDVALIDLKLPSGKSPWLWVIRERTGDHWDTMIVAGSKDQHKIQTSVNITDEVVVSAVSRTGREGPPAKVNLKGRGKRG
jgi:uncharacterized lipoprotein YddW (UPF0748 family)